MPGLIVNIVTPRSVHHKQVVHVCTTLALVVNLYCVVGGCQLALGSLEERSA